MGHYMFHNKMVISLSLSIFLVFLRNFPVILGVQNSVLSERVNLDSIIDSITEMRLSSLPNGFIVNVPISIPFLAAIECHMLYIDNTYVWVLCHLFLNRS